MKFVAIILSAFVVCVAASKTHYGAPAIVASPAQVVLASTGTSNQFRQEDNYGNSNFGYDESHATGATSRREETINGVTRGSYSLSEADGRRRLVTYIADVDGFRAAIQTNEPGVEPKDPASVLINKAAPVAVAVAPAPVLAAPAPLPAPVLAAPLPAPVLSGPLPLPAPVLSAPVTKGYGRLSLPAPIAVAQAPIAVQAPIVVEAPTPRQFSYSIGVSHLAAPSILAHQNIAAPFAPLAPLPAPVAAPIVQQQTIDY